MQILMSEFQNISPKVLTQMVSFYRDENSRHLEFDDYNPMSMQYKQAEGSAYLFNLLNEKKIALLADEVGMGKTIQSLAVCAGLWQQKPEARILILAPRNEVAFNWVREYETFVKVHYKLKDDVVKSRVDGKPINPAIFCPNLYDLVKEVKKGWGKLYIGKISSFSGLYSKDDVDLRLMEAGIHSQNKFNKIEDKRKSVELIGGLMREEIIKHLPQGYFDLVIIDEAHYFRNVDGDSLRVNSAKTFFGEGESRINRRALLLTATPNHTSSNNIRSIVSYFDDGLYSESKYDEILNDICLRRFRRLSEKGKVKYNYRKEISRSSDFKEDPMSELFFGIYQKQLVADYAKGVMHGSKKNILGFLEGTEFIPKETHVGSEEMEWKEGSDFSTGTDSRILMSLSQKYQSIFDGAPPSHPKYESLSKDLVHEQETLQKPNPKKLVFVRRIPSVREIAARAIYRYDEIWIKKLNDALGVKLELSGSLNDFRRQFELRSGLVDYEDDELMSNNEEETESDSDKVPTSKIMYLFKRLKKRQGVQISTHASNFRLRFTRSKPSVFNIFFSPAANYLGEPYQVDLYKSLLTGKGMIDDYYVSCLLERTSHESVPKDVAMKIRNTLAGRLDKLECTSDSVMLENMFTIYWRYLDSGVVPKDKSTSIKAAYQSFSAYQKEAFSSFIDKGILLASSALVDLYLAFVKASKNGGVNAYKLYQRFTTEVEIVLPSTTIPELIGESILNFKVLCEKVFSITTEDQLLNEEWKCFWDAQPAYAYSGDTKNNRVMSSFNTPFFPDILISTSVLQEGVNLQYFCDQIYHYGIAWTPGDNEQRVGRVDRMFSKIERSLNKDESSTLDIIYPYLKNTIDQDHLANFVTKKFLEENLIDRCIGYEGSGQLDPTSFNFENWKQYLRSPSQEKVIDPYPPKSNELQPCTFQYQDRTVESKIETQILNAFQELGVPMYRSQFSEDTLCVLDPTLANGNSQPVVIKLNYDPQLTGVMGEVTYTLSMITPIGKKRQIKEFEKKYQEFSRQYEYEQMAVKLCLDEAQSALSIFGIYAKIDLPVFVHHHERSLSSLELIHNYHDLIQCADYIEQVVLKDDLKLEAFEPQRDKLIDLDGQLKLRQQVSSVSVDDKWKRNGDYVYLRQNYSDPLTIRSLWEKNHQHRYIKYLPSKMIIPFCSKDMQSLEIRAMEKVAVMYW
jgi:hypothetical protein